VEILDNNIATIPHGGYILAPGSAENVHGSAPPPRLGSRLVPSIGSDYRISPSYSFQLVLPSITVDGHAAQSCEKSGCRIDKDPDPDTRPGSSDDNGYETLAVDHCSDLYVANPSVFPTSRATNHLPLYCGIQKNAQWSPMMKNDITGRCGIQRSGTGTPTPWSKMNSSTVGFTTVESHYPSKTSLMAAVPSGVSSKPCKRFPTMGQTCLRNSYARAHSTGAGEVTGGRSLEIVEGEGGTAWKGHVSPQLDRLENVDSVITNNFTCRT